MCVECLIGKQRNQFSLRSPSRVPLAYRTELIPAWVRQNYGASTGWTILRKNSLQPYLIPAYMRPWLGLRISIGMPNFEMPNLDSVNHCTSEYAASQGLSTDVLHLWWKSPPAPQNTSAMVGNSKQTSGSIGSWGNAIDRFGPSIDPVACWLLYCRRWGSTHARR